MPPNAILCVKYSPVFQRKMGFKTQKTLNLYIDPA